MTYLKTISTVGLLSATFFAASTAGANPPTSGAYVNDEQRFFVEGQPLTDAIEQASAIICYMASMRPDSFVNDGAYVAKIYEDRCETSGANATSEEASATATSAQSSTTASSSTSSTSIETEQAIEAVLDVRLASAGEPVKAKVWVEDKAQDEFELDSKIYIKVNQTGGVSDEAPNGEFEMWFSMHLDGDADLFGKFAGGPSGDDGPGFEIVDGQALGQGYLKASGTELQYRESGQGYESNIAMDFLASGDINGIYGQFANVCDGCGGDFANDPGTDNGGPGPDDGGPGPDDGGPGPDDGGPGPDDGGQGPDDGGQGPGNGGFDDGGSGGGPSFRNIMAFYQFYVNKQAKTYCKNFESAFELCFNPLDSDDCAEAYEANGEQTADGFNAFEPLRIELSQADLEDLLTRSDTSAFSTDENGALVTEECYSIDQSDATRNVFRYGVYNEDGSRLSVGDTSAFPMFAEVSVELPAPTQSDPDATKSVTERVFGFADYWGVFIDPRGRKLIAESGQQLSDIDFKREVFGPQDTSSPGTTYNVAESEIRVEKRTKSYQSLNDIDKIRIGLHVQDPFWNQEYKQLLELDESSNLFNLSITGEGNKTLNRVQEFQGAFEKNTYHPDDLGDNDLPIDGATPGVFVFDTAVAFQPFWDEVTLSEKIYFKPSDWVSTMKKEETFFGPNGPETFVNTRPMGVWSNDTFQWYDISAAALNDPDLSDPESSDDAVECADDIFALAPTDSCRGGIRTETSEFVSPSSLSEDLVCIRDCLSPSAMGQTFLFAYCKKNAESDPENCAGIDVSALLAPSPFADVGPYLKSDVSVIETFSDFQAQGMTEGFYLSENNLLRQGFRLASARAQVLDYVFVPGGTEQGITEDQSVPIYQRIDRPQNGNAKAGGILSMDLQGGLNFENLTELVSGRGGIAPAVTFDLMSTPPVGDSGSTPVTIELRNFDSGTRLMATIPVEWASTEAGFTLTVPAGSSYEVKLISENAGIELTAGTATVGNTQDDVFAYGGGLLTNGGRPGFTMRLLSLFGGDLGDVSSLNLESFIQQDGVYELTVNLGTLMFGEGPIPEPGPGLDLNTLRIQFGVIPGESQYFANTYQAGQFWDGIRDSEAVRYTPTASGFSVEGSPLTKGPVVNQFLSKSSDPFSALGNTQFARPDGWTENVSWGLRSGQLVAESELAELECPKRDGSQYEDHPAFTGNEETETRYCEQKLFESVSLTTYQIQVDVQPSYILLDSAGDVVTISPPRTLYYEVPDDTRYGRDAGKRLSLEFAGHGELRGIPGFIYDVATGQELGQFTREWKDTYRFINRFNIPDGDVVTDAEGVDYFVKALDGEEWLQKLDNGVTELGNYSFERSRLVPNQKLRILGDPNFSQGDYIGEPPTALCDTQTTTDCLINSGEPAVVHGEVVFDPTPTGE